MKVEVDQFLHLRKLFNNTLSCHHRWALSRQVPSSFSGAPADTRDEHNNETASTCGVPHYTTTAKPETFATDGASSDTSFLPPAHHRTQRYARPR